MSILSRAADAVRAFWKKDTAQQNAEDATKTRYRKPFEHDITEDIKVNGELTRGLFNNSYPGFKASGALAYAPIAVPVAFMGAPIPVPVDETNESVKEALEMLQDQMIGQCYEIERACHRDGTIWVWPYYSSQEGKLYWEMILDDQVTDIIKNVDTGEPIEIIINESITYKVNENTTDVVQRIRRFTKTEITDTYSQEVPTSQGDTRRLQIDQRRGRNVLGILPIPFANLPDTGKIRGNSDLQRIIPNLKLHNDILTQWSTQLAKFKPKLVQSTNDVDSWIANNGGFDVSTFNPQQQDFVVNDASKDEKSEYIFLKGMAGEYTEALNVHYWLTVQGSAIPEIVWGLVSTGNHASSEEQMASLMQYVFNKQIQATKPFEKLYNASLRLLGIAGMFEAAEVKITWNELDTLSPAAKAQVLANFATGIEKLVHSGVPTETLHKVFLDFYPNATEEDLETFRKQLSMAASRVAFLKAAYAEQQAAGGNDELDNLLDQRNEMD